MNVKYCYLGNTQKIIPQVRVKGDAKITSIITNLFPNASLLVTLYKLTIQCLPLVYQISVFSNIPTKVNLEPLSNTTKIPPASGILIFFLILALPLTGFGLSFVMGNPTLSLNPSFLTLRRSRSAQEQSRKPPLTARGSAGPAYPTIKYKKGAKHYKGGV